MKTYISILRGINVGGRKVLMTDLKVLFEGFKFKEVQTYIQSGNIIFKSDTSLSDTDLAKKIEAALLKKYGFAVPVIIRSGEEVEHIIKINPFLKNKNINKEKLHVTFLAEEPKAENLLSLKDVDYKPDEFEVIGKHIFIHCPDSYGETKLSNNFFEKKLKTSATTRNWKTVQKLLELATG